MIPSRLVNILWWMAYFAVGLTLQLRFAGVDALIPGIMLSCQEGRRQQTIWLCLCALLIQEGTGSLAFGGEVLWYGSLLLLFSLGKLFFVTGSLFFVVLLASVLGVLHSCMLYALSSLQGYSLDSYHLVQQAMAQTLLIPPLYAVASLARKRFLNYEYGI